ncbi:hypothetical protein GOP47_0002093 [Adiantum capillus-veneris]|uniref:Dehydrin n=1 Tax=Adiantum capillus-veneris TaxID=13818 RepID=A0A9D4V9H7_ADICA|nr:hypothetical protein GOP47_0002093 [Adiantum capillus-veneris]
MANMMEKIGDKLHMGGHKEEPHTVGAAYVPQYAAPGYATPGYGAAHAPQYAAPGYGAAAPGYGATHAPQYAAPGYGAAAPGYGAPTSAAPHQEGTMDKIKNKVKGKKNKVKTHGGESSRSESDGEGGRRV